MRTVNRSAVVVVPKQPLLDWLRSIDPTNSEMKLADVRKDATVYLLPEAASEMSLLEVLETYCDRIFEEELNAWHLATEDWPADRSRANSNNGSPAAFTPWSWTLRTVRSSPRISSSRRAGSSRPDTITCSKDSGPPNCTVSRSNPQDSIS